MSHLDPLASPALSETSNMSPLIDLSNYTSSSSAARSDESDDEIVYNISEAPPLSEDESLCSAALSDSDFVVLSRPRSQRGSLGTDSSSLKHDDEARADTSCIADLVTGLAGISVTPTLVRPQCEGKTAQTTVAIAGTVAKKRKKKKKQKKNKKSQTPTADAVASSSSGPFKRAATAIPVTEKRSVIKNKSNKVKKEKSNGFGGRSIADDVSDKFSGKSDIGSPSMYEEAFSFITSYVDLEIFSFSFPHRRNRFLSNPAARQDSACRLTLLQALIIELGLANSSLPCSVSAAKAYLKSRAFLNINEYIAVRDQGPEAVRRIMYPSRTALIKEIRKNKAKAPRGWVKDAGLQVLLVQCYH
ncbi:hypothetical protein C0993_006126 [Termitomyces sp. T159_Od127]|nr:hypothetical protein C0993_006126 [Termitomyces sp. T159_Od127]